MRMMDRSKRFAWSIVVPTMALLAILAAMGESAPSLSTFLFWISLLAASELLPMTLGVDVSITMSFPIHLALVIVFRHQPWVAMLIAGLGTIDLRELQGQEQLHKALFNRALSILSVGAASIPFVLVGSQGTVLNPLTIASASVLELVVNLGLLAVAIHLERGIPIPQIIGKLIPSPPVGFAISYMLLAGLGVATALAYENIENGGWAVAAILIPLLFARLSLLGARTQQQLSDRVRKQQKALLEATEKVFSERESERNRIAEEIHDSSLQMLAAAGYSSSNAGDQLKRGEIDEAQQTLATARSAIDEAIIGIRQSLQDLRRSTIEEGGLLQTIRHYADQMSTLWGTAINIEGAIETEPPLPVALASFQILQEGLANALKHGDAGSVDVRILEDDGMIHLIVEDRGPGFDPSEEIEGHHVGMALMKERAARVGGRINLASAPGSGTRLEAILPGGIGS